MSSARILAACGLVSAALSALAVASPMFVSAGAIVMLVGNLYVLFSEKT